jgi:hypothetical protein
LAVNLEVETFISELNDQKIKEGRIEQEIKAAKPEKNLIDRVREEGPKMPDTHDKLINEMVDEMHKLDKFLNKRLKPAQGVKEFLSNPKKPL